MVACAYASSPTHSLSLGMILLILSLSTSSSTCSFSCILANHAFCRAMVVRVALKCQGRFLFNPARCNVKDFHADTQGTADAVIKYSYPNNTASLPTVFCLFGTVSSSNVVDPVLLRPDAGQFHKFLSVVPLALEWQRTFAFFSFLYGYEHLGVRVAQNGGLSFGTRAGRLTNAGMYQSTHPLFVSSSLIQYFQNHLTRRLQEEAPRFSHAPQSLLRLLMLNSIYSTSPVAGVLCIPTTVVCFFFLSLLVFLPNFVNSPCV